jgi:hypothetical protein
MICFTYQKMDLYTLIAGMLGELFFFARADQIDKNVQKMIKDFEVANIMPSTDSCLLHQIEDRVMTPRLYPTL